MIANCLLALLLAPDPDVTLADLVRFPPPDVVKLRCEFAQNYLDWLDEEMERPRPWDESDYYKELWFEEHSLWYVWDDLRCAQKTDEPVAYRLRQLEGMRFRMGFDNYYRGVMPPHVPYWRWHRIGE